MVSSHPMVRRNHVSIEGDWGSRIQTSRLRKGSEESEILRLTSRCFTFIFYCRRLLRRCIQNCACIRALDGEFLNVKLETKERERERIRELQWNIWTLNATEKASLRFFFRFTLHSPCLFANEKTHFCFHIFHQALLLEVLSGVQS